MSKQDDIPMKIAHAILDAMGKDLRHEFVRAINSLNLQADNWLAWIIRDELLKNKKGKP